LTVRLGAATFKAFGVHNIHCLLRAIQAASGSANI
jgi:hypothetical protein